MIDWGSRPVNFYTRQNKEYEKIWYDKLFLSSKLNSPTEVPPTLEQFPEFIQKYLSEVNLPIYAELAKEKDITAEGREHLNCQKFKINLNAANQDVFVELRQIDPVYAVTNDPTLVKNVDFMNQAKNYSREIAIVSNSLQENLETKPESSPRLKLK